MRFFETILSGAALIAAVAAQAIEINDFPAEGVVAGQSYTITYSPADDTPTTFILRQGESTDLNTVDTITTSATGGSFTWTPSQSLPSEPDYALEIRRGDEVNYSAQFPLSGGSDEPAVSSAVSSAVASASSAASSAAYSASSMASSVHASVSASVSKSLASEASSLSSVIASAKSSVIASITETHASASATISPSAGHNSTISTATLSRSASGSASATTTESTGLPEVSEAAGNALIGSPMAAIFGAAAAFAYLA